MLKRITGVLLAVLLFLALPARAEKDLNELITGALYKIVLRTEEGDTTLGSAVLFMEQNLLLTAESCCAEGDLYAIGKDGEHAVKAWEKLGDAGLAAMELAVPSSAQPMTLADYNTEPLPYIFGANEAGIVGSVPMYQARLTMYREEKMLIFRGEEGLLPGAFVADMSGNIVGMVLAQQMEGVGMYVALDPGGIYSAVAGQDSAFLDITMSMDGGMLKIAWKDEKRTGGEYVITAAGGENNYYTTYSEEVGKNSCEILLPPGHTYDVQVQWVAEGAQPLPPDWSAMKQYTIARRNFVGYGFRQECYLTSGAAGLEGNVGLDKTEGFYTGMLTDPEKELYLQFLLSYDVEEQVEMPMSIELIAPDGQFFFRNMVYTFDDAYEKDDRFALSVKRLFDSCAQFSGGAAAPGEYTLRTSIGGMITGETTFTLQEGSAPAPVVTPAPDASSGVISGLKAVNEDGMVTVTWADAAIPEGAKVVVYYMYAGNTYYTYQGMLEDTREAYCFAVPGREMEIWATWSLEEQADQNIPLDERQHILVEAMPVEPMTDHGFTNHHISVVPSLDAEAGSRTELLPAAPITRADLTNPDMFFYFQTHDTYQVSEVSEDHPLAIVLITPDGECHVDEGFYIFDTQYQERDLWLKDVSGIFFSHDSMGGEDPWQPGEYRILYCIDGKIAGEFTFTLE